MQRTIGHDIELIEFGAIVHSLNKFVFKVTLLIVALVIFAVMFGFRRVI
jgi:hypothetical protein